MTTHSESRITVHPASLMFDLVADVERYPEFLPSWQCARVLNRDEQGYDTDQTVGMGLLARSFQTHTELERPRRIVVTSDDHVFRSFKINWAFEPLAEDRCRIECQLEFVVDSWLLAPALDMLMVSTASAMVSAFEERAHAMAAAPSPGENTLRH